MSLQKICTKPLEFYDLSINFLKRQNGSYIAINGEYRTGSDFIKNI